MESGVEFIAVDNPHANKLTVHILAAVAQPASTIWRWQKTGVLEPLIEADYLFPAEIEAARVCVSLKRPRSIRRFMSERTRQGEKPKEPVCLLNYRSLVAFLTHGADLLQRFVIFWGDLMVLWGDSFKHRTTGGRRAQN
jgi:hypothetical protein